MKRCISCELVDTDWWGLCSGVESSMAQGMSGLELEAGLPFSCPEFGGAHAALWAQRDGMLDRCPLSYYLSPS